jgi:hypothetical protein
MSLLFASLLHAGLQLPPLVAEAPAEWPLEQLTATTDPCQDFTVQRSIPALT